LLLLAAFFVNSAGITTANATMQLGGIAHVCISVFDLTPNGDLNTRNDLADRVSRIVRTRVKALQPYRNVWAKPECIKPDLPGFDRQLMLVLSVKRQKLKLDGRDWNLVIAGGVSTENVFQDRALQPIVIAQQESISDDSVVDALVEFVDRSVISALRR
jgi:hypothetical protein